jgi:hypothetical protein
MMSSRARGDTSGCTYNVPTQKYNILGPGGGEVYQKACQVIMQPNNHHQGCKVLNEVSVRHHQRPSKDHVKGCIIVKHGLSESSDTNHHGYKSP